MAECIVAEVGKFYMVPCIRLLVTDYQHPAAGRDGWIPTIGPEHQDRGVIGFQAMHVHIDVRFLSEVVLHRNRDPWKRMPAQKYLMGFPVSTYSDGESRPPLPHEKKLRRMKCKHEAIDFPVNLAHKWIPKLEQEHACTKLKPGNICPHRGIDLTPFIKDDGTVICPGHGLRWNTNTGALIPHEGEAPRA